MSTNVLQLNSRDCLLESSANIKFYRRLTVRRRRVQQNSLRFHIRCCDIYWTVKAALPIFQASYADEQKKCPYVPALAFQKAALRQIIVAVA